MELQIIRAHEFIRLGADDYLDLAASKALLAELASACRKRGIQQALLDVRDLRPRPKPWFSPSDLAALINTFREIGFKREDKLAVLYYSDPHHRAREFAFMGRLRGWNVRAFDNYEEAFTWLALTKNGKPKTAEYAPRLKAGKTKPPAPITVRKARLNNSPSV
jgi:hypothetical protein